MIEKRQYVRMNTVFPVEFEVVQESGERKSSRLLQGFTRDVGAGGMCIELKSFGKETDKLFQAPHACRLELTINPPFAAQPILAAGRIAWLRRNDQPLPVRYLIGVAYTRIDDTARQRLLAYARRLRWVPRAAAAAGAGLLIVSMALFVNGQRLVRDNLRLVNQLIESAEKKSSVAEHLYQLQKRRAILETDLIQARLRIKELEGAEEAARTRSEEERRAFKAELEASRRRQTRLDAQLGSLAEGREKLLAAYKTLETKAEAPATAAREQMFRWLQSHQNLRTGLVASYEGDATLEDWAFTYDQSLAAQAFLLAGDQDAAARILEFYDQRAAAPAGAFHNAYATPDGSVAEPAVRVGPNVWIALAALQHAHRTGRERFVPLARRVGDWLEGLQDVEGGVKGGPDVSWYSTEHNLDAYALFRLLAERTGDDKYARAAERSLGWIRKYAYTAKERRLNRGKGDSTIATDTFSWAIAAIGPETLERIEFDPEGIMEFAEKHCAVAVDYRLPGGKPAKVKGFDFAKAQNVGRGGIISTEWTAQVIVTYRILAGYFERKGEAAKAELYRGKAEMYLNELLKLIITSPSRTGQGRGCLPYASTDNVDTGHGWRTPKGQRTGSVAGTAYGLFAWLGYNPFRFDNPPEANAHVQFER